MGPLRNSLILSILFSMVSGTSLAGGPTASRPAETYIMGQVLKGMPADLEGRFKDRHDRTIRASFLRLLIGSDPKTVRTGRDGLAINGAVVAGPLSFSKLHLNYPLSLSRCEFRSPVDFSHSAFGGLVSFQGTQFSGEADFTKAQFSGNADFLESRFLEEAFFGETAFSKEADFSAARFAGETDFSESSFLGRVTFGASVFSKGVYFWGAGFSDDASFARSRFANEANFSQAIFSGKASLAEAKFMGRSHFTQASFAGIAEFLRAAFHEDATFRGATFSEVADFSETRFSQRSYFSEVTFAKNVYFIRAVFSREIDFKRTRFSEKIFLESVKDFSGMIADWEGGLKGKLAYDRAVYIALIKNYQDIGMFPQADDAYYTYRSEGRKRRENSTVFLEKLKGKSELCFLEIPFGYGVKPFNLFYTFSLFWLSFSVLYLFFTKKEAHYPPTLKGTLGLFGSYMRYNWWKPWRHVTQLLALLSNNRLAWSLIHSIDNLTPGISFRSMETIGPNVSIKPNSRALIYLERVQQALGWYLLVLLLIMFNKIAIR